MEVQSGQSGDVVWSYDDIVRLQLATERPAWTRHECVFPGWDHSPRRGAEPSTIVHGSEPDRYEGWLSAVHARTPGDGLVLINAWNEWAEGAYLEPDLRYGRAYLDATARAVGIEPGRSGVNAARAAESASPPDRRFAAMYLEARENETRLRRRLSRLEGTFQRQLDEAAGKARAEAEEMRAQALRFAQEIDRLRAELARLETRLAGADT